jgi:tetratricopeptide (TPR) repeat protein
MGWCYQCQSEWTDAITAYRAVMTSAPVGTARDDYYTQYARVHLAECYRDNTDLDNSIAYYLAVAADCPENAGNYKLDAAEQYMAKEDYVKATQICEDVVANYPEAKDRALRLFGKCLRAQNKLGEAQEKFNEALAYLENLYTTNPDTQVDTLLRIVDIYDGTLQDYPKAIEALNKLITEHPNAPEVIDAELRIATLTLFGLRDMSTARTMLQDYITKHPGSDSLISAAYALGYASYIEGNYAEAAVLFEDATKYKEVGNYYAAITYKMADCYMRTGDLEKSKELVDYLLETYPNDCWAKLAADKYSELTTPSANGGTE